MKFVNDLLKKFGYLHIDEIEILIKKEMKVYKETPPVKGMTTKMFDKLSDKRRNEWFDKRRGLDEKSSVVEKVGWEIQNLIPKSRSYKKMMIKMFGKPNETNENSINR